MKQNGFLILADISGNTELLTQAELEHGLDIVQRVLNSLISTFTGCSKTGLQNRLGYGLTLFSARRAEQRQR